MAIKDFLGKGKEKLENLLFDSKVGKYVVTTAASLPMLYSSVFGQNINFSGVIKDDVGVGVSSPFRIEQLVDSSYQNVFSGNSFSNGSFSANVNVVTDVEDVDLNLDFLYVYSNIVHSPSNIEVKVTDYVMATGEKVGETEKVRLGNGNNVISKKLPKDVSAKRFVRHYQVGDESILQKFINRHGELEFFLPSNNRIDVGKSVVFNKTLDQTLYEFLVIAEKNGFKPDTVYASMPVDTLRNISDLELNLKKSDFLVDFVINSFDVNGYVPGDSTNSTVSRSPTDLKVYWGENKDSSNVFSPDVNGIYNIVKELTGVGLNPVAYLQVVNTDDWLPWTIGHDNSMNKYGKEPIFQNPSSLGSPTVDGDALMNLDSLNNYGTIQVYLIPRFVERQPGEVIETTGGGASEFAKAMMWSSAGKTTKWTPQPGQYKVRQFHFTKNFTTGITATQAEIDTSVYSSVLTTSESVISNGVILVEFEPFEFYENWEDPSAPEYSDRNNWAYMQFENTAPASNTSVYSDGSHRDAQTFYGESSLNYEKNEENFQKIINAEVVSSFVTNINTQKLTEAAKTAFHTKQILMKLTPYY